MKKFLLSLACALSVFTMSGDEITLFSTTSTPTWTKSGDNYEASVDGFKLVLAKAGSSTDLVMPTSAHLRLYQGATLTITAPGGVTMTKVAMTEVYTKGTSLSHAEFSEGWTAYGALTSSQKAEEFGATSAGLGTMTLTGGKQLRISQLIVTYSGTVVNKDDAELSFPEASYSVTLGETFTAPQLSKMTDAAPVYSSSKEDVATVDAATGAVTVVGTGKTVITAECAETEDFFAGTASYTLVVVDPNQVYAWAKGGAQEWTFDGNDGTMPWQYNNTYGLKGSAFVSSAAHAIDAVAASPVVDLTEKVAPIALNARVAYNQYKDNGTMIEPSLLGNYAKIVVREEGETEWKVVADATTQSFSWDFFDMPEVDLAAYAGKKIQFGFRYISTATCAGTWEVDNIVLTASPKSQGVESIESADQDAPVVYYNLQGVRVDNPSNGLFIRVQGKTACKVLVK